MHDWYSTWGLCIGVVTDKYKLGYCGNETIGDDKEGNSVCLMRLHTLYYEKMSWPEGMSRSFKSGYPLKVQMTIDVKIMCLGIVSSPVHFSSSKSFDFAIY